MSHKQNYEKLQPALWLILYSIQKNDVKAGTRAVQLLKELKISEPDIFYLCSRCYAEALKFSTDMLWNTMIANGRVTEEDKRVFFENN